jgi:hypothetical protein
LWTFGLRPNRALPSNKSTIHLDLLLFLRSLAFTVHPIAMLLVTFDRFKLFDEPRFFAVLSNRSDYTAKKLLRGFELRHFLNMFCKCSEAELLQSPTVINTPTVDHHFFFNGRVAPNAFLLFPHLLFISTKTINCRGLFDFNLVGNC